jgi:DNA-binding response OmpR family regulator
MRVLVVEDDDLLREIVCDQLREHGFTVLEAASGEEAIAHCAAPVPDMLVADAGLPGVIDGYELASRFRHEKPDIIVVYASGRPCLDETRTVPGAIFLRKPFRISRLAEIIEEHLQVGPKAQG